jgi:methylmalonyl-CoA mutase
MIDDVFRRVRAARRPAFAMAPLNAGDHRQLARCITMLEGEAGQQGSGTEALRKALARPVSRAPVVGITGTGGAGKSSLTDELLQRLLRAYPERRIAVVAVDPTRRRSGGALLGDRIRMNSLSNSSVFMRSLATRRQNLSTSAVLKDVIELYQQAGFDLILVETAGIGQSDTEIVDLVDVSTYVMTADYGAASQLEKIDMLDFADLVVLNKFEKRGAADALRDVRKQWRRNHPERMKIADADVPVYPTIASRFNDPGVNRLFAALCARLDARAGQRGQWLTDAIAAAAPANTVEISRTALIPENRGRYLADIAAAGRGARTRLEESAAPRARRRACIAPCRRSATRNCRYCWIATPPARSKAARAKRRATPCGSPTTGRSTRSAPRAWRCCAAGRRASAASRTPSTATSSAARKCVATITSRR